MKKLVVFLIASHISFAQSDCVTKATTNPSMPTESFSYSNVYQDMIITKSNEILIAPIGDDRLIKTYKNGNWSNLTQVTVRGFNMRMTSDNKGNIYYLYDNSESVPIPAIEKYSNGTTTNISPAFFSSVKDAGAYQIITDNNNDVFAGYVVNSNPHVFKYTASAESWTDISGILASKKAVSQLQLRADDKGKLYLGFLEEINSVYQFRVYSYSGTNWSDVGSGGLTNAASIAFEIDNLGKPNIAMFVNEKLSFLKLENGQWNIASYIDYPGSLLASVSLNFDSGNIPYIAFYNTKQKSKVTVLKLESSTWDTVGVLNAGVYSDFGSTGLIFKLDKNDVPNLFFNDRSIGAQNALYQYKDGVWKLAGERGLLDIAISGSTIAKDTSDNIYVTCSQFDNIGKINLYRYTGDSLALIGDAGIANGANNSVKMTITSNNKIWVVAQEYLSHNNTVKTYFNAVWSTVGTNFSIGEAQYLALSAIDSIPYLAYGDKGDQNRVYVKRYRNKLWETVGGGPISIGEGRNISITCDNDGTPYLCYQEVDNNTGITIKKFVNGAWKEIANPNIKFFYGDVILKISPDNIPYVAMSTTDLIDLMKYQDNKWTFFQNGSVGFWGILEDLSFDNSNRPVIASSDWYTSTGSTSVSKWIDDQWKLIYKTNHGGEATWSMELLRRNGKIFVKEESKWLRFVEIDPDCIVLENKFDVSKNVKQEISIYPNPSNGSVAFENLEDKCSLRILDVNGSEKGKFQLSTINNSIDTQFLPSGIYFFKFEEPGKYLFSKKFVKL